MPDTYSDSTPLYRESEVTTLKKILAAVNGSGGGGSGGGAVNNYVYPPPASSDSPGQPGQYSSAGGNFMFYDQTQGKWYNLSANLF